MFPLNAIILGVAAIGGSILLVLGLSSKSKEDSDSLKGEGEISPTFDQEEVRRLRKDLKKQLKLKKKSAPPTTATPKDENK